MVDKTLRPVSGHGAGKMRPAGRLLIAVAAVAMIATYFLPLWSIYLIAPQYPEGLEMNIWLNKLSGEVEIINGLNHYIGMRKIDAAMFPEFHFLPFIIAFFVVLGLIVAIVGRHKFLGWYCLLLSFFAAAALVDFYQWGYNYGHHLDPTAPIQVPGLSYQPPVLGHKKLLNFDAYSYPDTGGWVVIVAALVFFAVWFVEWRKHKTTQVMIAANKKLATAASLFLFLVGCTPQAEEISYGKDMCADCKMTIVDPHFSGEIVSRKGRVYKFDDARCMALFFKRRGIEMDDVHQTLFSDYADSTHAFVKTRDAHFVVSSKLKSPMNGNAAAFSSAKIAEQKAAETDGKLTNWSTLYNILIK